MSGNNYHAQRYNHSTATTVTAKPNQREDAKRFGGLDPSIPFMDPFGGHPPEKRRQMSKVTVETCAMKYLARIERTRAKSTVENLDRRYRKMGKDIEYLWREGWVTTINPIEMTYIDVFNYLQYRISTGVSNSEMVHCMAAVSSLLGFLGNGAYAQAVSQFPDLKIKKDNDRYPSIDPEVCERVIAKAMTIGPEDWFNTVRYAVVVFAICTGMRAKELRLCDIDCISIDEATGQWFVAVLHPKGEKSYGKPRRVVVDPEGIPFLQKYFKRRAVHMERMQFGSHAVFVGSKRSDDHLSANTLRAYADYVSAEMGADLDLRSCRRTYGQRLIDRGVDINTVSKMMGHKSTVTTERYYCSMDEQQAISNVASAYSQAPRMEMAKRSSQMPRGLESILGSDPEEVPEDRSDPSN